MWAVWAIWAIWAVWAVDVIGGALGDLLVLVWAFKSLVQAPNSLCVAGFHGGVLSLSMHVGVRWF